MFCISAGLAALSGAAVALLCVWLFQFLGEGRPEGRLWPVFRRRADIASQRKHGASAGPQGADEEGPHGRSRPAAGNNAAEPEEDQAYPYRPLNTISPVRLIEVLPEPVDGTIVCKVHQRDIGSASDHPYCALSYLWGNPDKTRKILLEDDTGRRYAQPLHENIWQFLNRAFQQGRFGVLFWTDSLCLNQKDKEEMAQQIPRMGRIYSAAAEVLIWLGHDEVGERGFDLVQECPMEEYGRVRDAAIRLLLLPYWSRVWIVQEVVLARKARVAYGNITRAVDIDDLRSQLDAFQHETPELNYQPTIWNLCKLREKQGSRDLWDIISTFELCNSTKTVDKVYGFLGLADEGIGGRLEVNPDKEPLEVLWDVLFEFRSPRDDFEKFDRVLQSLQRMFLLDANFSSLQKYANHKRTSQRHRRMAEVALCVLDAANIVRMHCITETGSQWREAVLAALASAATRPQDVTEDQNAALVGLATTGRGAYSSWWQSSRRRTKRPSPWRCVTHQLEARHSSATRSLAGATPSTGFLLGQEALSRDLGCNPMSGCDLSMMVCDIPDIGFRLVLHLRPQENVEIIGQAQGYIFLDLWHQPSSSLGRWFASAWSSQSNKLNWRASRR
ncbi:heterokaryon incompatibility protein-domain-containing protein [Diplogelasinospora grovesii]|uniref:Heterokaryon incompatibility protein-domain-containing protein n=1 Tax=Diplogelasinospora grovesii TaxID=303347 RepID=A0AAN6S2L2_9PEZI|nr:heterokaryon incompatibility protein-domain-containing protein [Diplogelasinospora grovesii]